MKSFHFDVGDSTKGPIGFCARVIAENRERALEILRERLAGNGAGEFEQPLENGAKSEEYLTFYANGDHVTINNIDEEDDADEDDDE